MNNFLKKGERNLDEIYSRVKKRDFSGSEGQEIKNSFFVITSSFVAKIGALVFTIILARLLMPELFGLYSIILSFVMILIIFSDLGIQEAIVNFVSRELGKNKKSKAKAYFIYFLKTKFVLVLFISLVLLVSAKFLANDLLGKPIFLGLVAGAVYLFFLELSGVLEALLFSTNKFKDILLKQTIFQVARIILVPILVILGIKYYLSDESKVFLVLMGLTLAVVISTLITYFISRKNLGFLDAKKESLTERDISKARVLLFTMPAIALSGLFFGEVDILFLGYFVTSEFAGYYRAVLGLVAGLVGLVTFSSALLPVFSRLKKTQIEKDFEKFLYLTILSSTILAVLVFIFAPTIIRLIYGNAYLISSDLLKLFSLIIILSPLISLYETYFISQRKIKTITKFLILSTIFNAIITFFFISYLLNYGQIYAVYGAIIASIISQFLVLIGLVVKKSKE